MFDRTACFFGLPFESHGTPLEPNRILCQNFPLYTPAWPFFAPGARPGFAFKLGPMGLGYYQDVAPDGEEGDLVNGVTCRFDMGCESGLDYVGLQEV